MLVNRSAVSCGTVFVSYSTGTDSALLIPRVAILYRLFLTCFNLCNTEIPVTTFRIYSLGMQMYVMY